MPIERQFLGWSKPALPAAADWMVARYQREGELDLSQTIVVVPGARAGRRLTEILVARSEEQSLLLTPPTITTGNSLPELLYQPKRPFATQLTQQLAWAAALRETPPNQRRHLTPHPPKNDDAMRWLELGNLLRGLHLELAGDGLDFNDVLAGAKSVDGFAEHDRWQVLADIQNRYLRKLDALELWDVQTARLFAIKLREPQTDCDILLLGTADLNRAQRQLLDLVADRVTALVFAPADQADRFDEHGTLIPEKWINCEIPLKDELVERVDGPADQAEAVSRWLASLQGKYRADEIVVGVPDERLAPHLQRELNQRGVASRWIEAKKLSDTGPYRLLSLLADYAERRRFDTLAALVRHPHFFDWLTQQTYGKLKQDPLTALDEMAARQLPARIDEDRLKKDKQLEAVCAVWKVVEALVKDLPAKPLALADWAKRFRDVLLAVYGTQYLDRDQPADRIIYASFQGIEQALAELEQVPTALMPQMAVREAFRTALEPLANEQIPPPANADAIELLGWLELPLDDAPALVVTSFNEGFVPKSGGADLFLPNCLRQQLGLDHNDRRFARDAYALTVLCESRSQLKLIVARRDVDSNPLAPTRLLFAADEHTVARRAKTFFSPLPPSTPRRNLLAPASGVRAVSTFAIPEPQPPLKALERMSVTRFRAYLACPYRFYLRHVLELESLTDAVSELDPAAFGNLLHDVLQHFGRDEDAKKVRTSTNSELIFAYLTDQLDKRVGGQFALAHCRPAVAVQVEQARARLKALADWQANRTAQGWQIVHSEDFEKHLQTTFDVDGQPIELLGRIDRIDYLPVSSTLAVLDYKTADTAGKPQHAHMRRGEWIDLQLPLYRHLIRGLKLPVTNIDECTIQLGYIRIPKDARQVGECLAEWSDDELAHADETARKVIRAIRRGVFWPPASPAPAFCDDLASICQDNRLGRWRSPSDGEPA